MASSARIYDHAAKIASGLDEFACNLGLDFDTNGVRDIVLVVYGR